MKFVAPIMFVVATSLLGLACGGPPRPKGKPPSGPPPEYEAPRSFDLPGSKPQDAPPPTPGADDQPAAPTP